MIVIDEAVKSTPKDDRVWHHFYDRIVATSNDRRERIRLAMRKVITDPEYIAFRKDAYHSLKLKTPDPTDEVLGRVGACKHPNDRKLSAAAFEKKIVLMLPVGRIYPGAYCPDCRQLRMHIMWDDTFLNTAHTFEVPN